MGWRGKDGLTLGYSGAKLVSIPSGGKPIQQIGCKVPHRTATVLVQQLTMSMRHLFAGGGPEELLDALFVNWYEIAIDFGFAGQRH